MLNKPTLSEESSDEPASPPTFATDDRGRVMSDLESLPSGR